MKELLIPQDYAILNSWVNEINGNDSEMENTPMGFKRNNKNIVGYMMVDNSEKLSCIGDGVVQTGSDNKPWIESDGYFGKGMYFYEYNYRYALDVSKSKRLDIVGAVISLNNVLDFTDGTVINIINENGEKFRQYITQLIQNNIKKLQGLKNTNSETYKGYSIEIERLNNGNINIADYLKFLDALSKKEKRYKYDAIRFINVESNNFLGIPTYQATMISLKDQKKVVEYFNPLNKQEREYIENKYFQNSSK